MPRRRQKQPPVPKTWLTRPHWTGPQEGAKEALLSGRTANPGTKQYIRSLLLAAGWDVEDVDPVLGGRTQPKDRLSDTWAELGKPSVEAGKLLTILRKQGFPGTVIKHAPKTTPLWVQEIWDSLTLHPWWAGAPGGQRSMVLVSQSGQGLARTTASFVFDLWKNLGAYPAVRLPTVRRLNLFNWSSAEALQRFETTVGPSTDVAVVSGGVLDQDHHHTTLGYLGALMSSFRGVLLYEALLHESLTPEALLMACRRTGFSTVFGTGSVDG